MQSVLIRKFGVVDYLCILQEMQNFTICRTELTIDEIWCLQHEPVYTQGQAGLAKYIRQVGNIPVVKSDRGGQITYHAPGQLIIYVLSNLKRLNLDIHKFISFLEKAVISMLNKFDIVAESKHDAPGVYIDGAKIAFLGLRVKNWCSYHGISLNVAMDLTPFSGIDPCGFYGLPITQLRDLGITQSIEDVQELLITELLNIFEYKRIEA